MWTFSTPISPRTHRNTILTGTSLTSILKACTCWNDLPAIVLYHLPVNFHLASFPSRERGNNAASTCAVLATDLLEGICVVYRKYRIRGPILHRYQVKSRAWEDNFFIKSGGFRASTLVSKFCSDHIGGEPRQRVEKKIKVLLHVSCV